MPATQELPKDMALRIIQDQPADSTLDDLIRELLMHRMIQRGLDDLDAGRTISHDEMKRRIESWQKRI